MGADVFAVNIKHGQTVTRPYKLDTVMLSLAKSLRFIIYGLPVRIITVRGGFTAIN